MRSWLAQAARAASALVMAGCVGIGAAGLASISSLDDAADRATFVALTMLLMFPLAVIADIDWDSGRRRASIRVVSLAIAAATAALIFPTPAYIVRAVQAHQLSVVLLCISGLAIWVLARRLVRSGREAASDSAT
jgi:hypothetical protein